MPLETMLNRYGGLRGLNVKSFTEPSLSSYSPPTGGASIENQLKAFDNMKRMAHYKKIGSRKGSRAHQIASLEADRIGLQGGPNAQDRAMYGNNDPTSIFNQVKGSNDTRKRFNEIVAGAMLGGSGGDDLFTTLRKKMKEQQQDPFYRMEQLFSPNSLMQL